jgi:iron(III) transport system substrate-binding protein
MSTRKILLTGAGILATTLALSGCGGGPADTSDETSSADGLGGEAIAEQMDALYQAAIESGETRVVTYGPGEERYAPVYEAFTQRYPEIDVVPEYIFGADLSTRLDQEYGSGNRVGSLVNGGPNITLLTSGQDRCDSYETITGGDLSADLVGPDDTYRAINRWVFGLLYNSDELEEADAPTSWSDLTDPQYSGKIVISDPTVINDSSVTLMALLYGGAIDEEWMRDVAANDPEIVANSQLAGQAVATGQQLISLGTSYNAAFELIGRDLPVSFVLPDDGARLEAQSACILTDNPAPDATRLLVDWFYTPEGQQAFAETGVYSAFDDGPSPEGLPMTEEVVDVAVAQPPIEEYLAETRSTIELTGSIFQ